MSNPRLRVFAGPNGSGKSTLFDAFSKKYNTGIFLNADLIENELKTKGFIFTGQNELLCPKRPNILGHQHPAPPQQSAPAVHYYKLYITLQP